MYEIIAPLDYFESSDYYFVGLSEKYFIASFPEESMAQRYCDLFNRELHLLNQYDFITAEHYAHFQLWAQVELGWSVDTSRVIAEHCFRRLTPQ